nr:hypothetical protein [uncultured Pseudomonas sp.]
MRNEKPGEPGFLCSNKPPYVERVAALLGGLGYLLHGCKSSCWARLWCVAGARLWKLHWNVGPHHFLQSTSGLRHNLITLETLFSCPADIPMQPLAR